MRRVTFALLAILWILSIVAYPELPDRIAIHFDARGYADGWSDKPHLAWFSLPLIGTFSVLFMYGVAKLSIRSPRLWNMPEKTRFLALTPEQRVPIMAGFIRLLDLVALYTVILIGIAQHTVYRSALSSSARLPWYFGVVLWGGLVAMIIYAVVWGGRAKKMILAATS